MEEQERMNIPLFKVFMSDNAIEAAAKVLRSGYIGQGSVTEDFEKDLRAWFGEDLLVTTNSATSAEHIAIYLLKRPIKARNWPGWEVGDEMLATPLTCSATNTPAVTLGLRLKWVDIDPKTLGMDLDDLARKITPKTKIIFPVLWGGMSFRHRTH